MGQLPTGTVTFLFTDIEGSTRRWQDDPSMSAVLARHDEMLRDAVDAQRGSLIKHTGDGALAVFDSAADGVRAAVDAQRMLGREHWEGGPLRVRMALHSGEAQLREGDYFGTALNMTARLMHAAHGGQILVSRAVEELIRDRMPQRTWLVDLGNQRLRDFDRPEPVFRVAGEELEDGFPPLSTAVEVPTNLPEPRSSFVGRGADMAELVRLVGEQRLVTLVGVGGAGKTRLAIEVGRRLVREATGEFTDGVYFADLSALTEDAAVVRAVAEALGMPPVRGPSGTVAGGSTEDKLVTFLHQRRALLILDNCEHLLDACAELVDRLLSAAHGLTILATSREALALEGEHSWQVRSLSLPSDESADDAEALSLLIDRIRAVRPGFELHSHNRAALAEICVRLDGIPLALELAAARAAHLAPREIAERLNDRFTLLAGGRRRSQRQQTLQATVDWSYDLLRPDEQAVLRRLAVFAGGFGLEAAAGVCLEGIDRSAVDLVGSLVDQSLVLSERVEGRSRYRLLETIRLYAEQKLVQAGEAETTRTAHRDWYLERLEAQPWDRCLLSESFATELNRDYDNLQSALEWCQAQARPDLLRRLLLRVVSAICRYGRFAEAQRWFDDVLEHERTLPRHEWFAHVVVEWADTWRVSGDLNEIEASLVRVGALTDDLPDGSAAKVLGHLTRSALLAVFPRRAPEVERYGDLAAEQAGVRYPLMRAWGLFFSEGVAPLYQRRYEEADRSLDQLCRSPHWDAEAEATYLPSILAAAHHLLGRHEAALRTLDGIQANWDAELRSQRTTVALSTAALGQLAAARQQMRQLVSTVRTAGWEHQHPLARSDCLVGLAGLAALEGDNERASRLVAAVPNMATGTPLLWVLLRHYRDLARDELDVQTRRRCIEQGQAMRVEDAIDSELARWHAEQHQPRTAPES